jgi:pimeloyl-ACP methyl ester carboxylesterase
MRRMSRAARRAVAVALVAAGALGGAAADAGAAGPQVDPEGYCVESNHAYDPVDLEPSPVAVPPGATQRTISVDGIRTPLLEAGPRDSREAIVFLHGNPGSSQDWVDLLGAAGRFQRAVAFDLPGFGRAAKPWDFDYTLAGYERFFAHALDRLGIERADLVVHDLGGPLGMEWAARHPERLNSAVIIDSGVLLGYQHHYLAQIWRTPAVGELFQASIDRTSFHAGVSNGNPRGLPDAFVDRMYDDYDRATRCAVLKLYRSADDPNAFATVQANALRPYDRPALVIWGQSDPYLPAAMAYRQREAFPHADVHVFEDSGHWPFVDNPGATADLVVPFLRRWAAGEARPSLRLRTRRLRLGRRAALSIPVSCAGTRPCRGWLRLRIGAATPASRWFELQPGTVAGVRLALAARVRRRVRRARVLHARLILAPVDGAPTTARVTLRT